MNFHKRFCQQRAGNFPAIFFNSKAIRSLQIESCAIMKSSNVFFQPGNVHSTSKFRCRRKHLHVARKTKEKAAETSAMECEKNSNFIIAAKCEIIQERNEKFYPSHAMMIHCCWWFIWCKSINSCLGEGNFRFLHSKMAAELPFVDQTFVAASTAV